MNEREFNAIKCLMGEYQKTNLTKTGLKLTVRSCKQLNFTKEQIERMLSFLDYGCYQNGLFNLYPRYEGEVKF